MRFDRRQFSSFSKPQTKCPPICGMEYAEMILLEFGPQMLVRGTRAKTSSILLASHGFCRGSINQSSTFSTDTIGQLLVTTLERHVCGAYVAALVKG